MNRAEFTRIVREISTYIVSYKFHIFCWYIVLALQGAGGDPDVGDEGVVGVLGGVEGEADIGGSLGCHSGQRGDTWHLTQQIQRQMQTHNSYNHG